MTVWELNASATASNVNGGGFNPANTNMLTDLTTDSNTANTASPVVSSASYNFAAGDVNHWLYIKSGTNWTPGWYQIASVASNKATLSAAIGAAVQTNSTVGYPTPKYIANTVVGCATVGTPTSGTFSIDYSQSTAAKINGVADFNAVGASTTLTSATAGFTPVMVGNLFHQTTTGTGAFGVVGWYEIVSYTNATTVVLDRTPNSGTASVNTTGYVGGAMSMNSTLDDALFESFSGTNGTGGMHVFLKNGTFSTAQGISLTIGIGGTTAPIVLEGYNTIRGDSPTGTNRPTFNNGANAVTLNNYFDIYNIIFTGTTATLMTAAAGNKFFNCKMTNTSTTAARNAHTAGTGSYLQNCELISYRGTGIILSTVNSAVMGCYLHDSNIGVIINATGGVGTFVHCIIADNVTAALNTGAAVTAGFNVINCTLYGAENKLGIGGQFIADTSAFRVVNSIIYGFATGMAPAGAQTVMIDMYNTYFNNTADVSNFQKATTSIALNPNFTNMTQMTGTGATSSTNVLTDAGANFSTVTDNVDFVYLSAGTGTGIGLAKYLITAHTTTTLTVSSIITSSGSGSAIAYQITLGHNFGVGPNMKAKAFPGMFDTISTTGYLDIGAVQRQEPTVAYPYVM